MTRVPPPSPSPFSLPTLLTLALFSLLGYLAREGTTWLATYPNAPTSVGPVVWANLVGSALIGFLSADDILFSRFCDPPSNTELTSTHRRRESTLYKTKKTVPLYIGLATGFCGSYTSFGTFIRDAFLAMSNDLGTGVARSRGYSVVAPLGVVIMNLLFSCGGYAFGTHIHALGRSRMAPLDPKLTSRIIIPSLAGLGAMSWLAVVVLSFVPTASGRADYHPPPPWRTIVYSLALSPIGTFIRYTAGLYLNPKFPRFPLGTFLANIVGTVLLGLFFDLQHSTSLHHRSVLACHILTALMDGFCGCLTTVSSFVAELAGLKLVDGYRYGSVSVVASLCALVVVMGSSRWSSGWSDPVC